MRHTRLEVDLDNIAYNIRQIRQRITSVSKMMAVVKADGYNHGIIEVAEIAIKNAVDWLGVAELKEAVILREAGIQLPILVLGMCSPTQAGQVVRYGLSQTVCDHQLVKALSAEAQSLGQVARVHVKVDTGMGRLGLLPREAVSFVEEIVDCQSIAVEGIFTHFSTAHEKDKSHTKLQVKRFTEVITALEKKGIDIPIKHAANSAAVLDIPSAYFDLVRIGIMLYGLYPSSQVSRSIHLRPALSFRTQVVYLKTVPVGFGIGYGRTFVTRRKTRIATLPVGYAHGYNRALSGKGEVLIEGKRAPVLGTVCMNMTLVDVSHIPGVKVGDEAVLFGKQEGAEITVDELALKIGTISHEILCNVNREVPRIYIKKGRNISR